MSLRNRGMSLGAAAALSGLVSGGLGAAVPQTGVPGLRDTPAFGADVPSTGFHTKFVPPIDLAESQSPADPAAVAALVSAVRTALQGLPEGARTEDYEAAVVFALDQSGQPPQVVMAALSQLQTNADSRLTAVAFANAQLARRRNANYGTGALAGSAISSSLSTDDAPAVILGGGTNYGG